MRELKFNQSCQSEFIVKFFGAFVMDDSTTAIAMEFCEGRSLEKVYKMVHAREGRCSEIVLGKIACGVLRGLTYLHEKHIIHRGTAPGRKGNSRCEAGEYFTYQEGGGEVM
jgi:mitogen-activated protein kinase kinase